MLFSDLVGVDIKDLSEILTDDTDDLVTGDGVLTKVSFSRHVQQRSGCRGKRRSPPVMFAVTPEMDETGVVKSMAIGQVMTTNPVSVERSQPLSEVYHLLRGSSFHHLPVVEGNHPVGVISSTDILKLVYDIEESSDRMLTQMLDYQFTIDDAMTTDLVTLPDTATVHDAADRLADGKFHSVLVIDLVGTLVGIVTTTDLVRFLRDL